MLSELYNNAESYHLLIEANLINTKAPFNGVGLVPYLKNLGQHISDDQIRAQFVSKLSKLLVNEAEWHEAVRELPHDAPDWARQALENRDLYAFVPDENLNDQLANIIHYLEAAYTAAMDKTDNDEMVVAKKELQGFPKSGSVAEITKKANEYFKRGSGKVEHKLDGMIEIGKSGPYKWYLLTTPEAYRREGKVLQNCIGKIVTYASCKKNGTSIIVMKTSDGESVVGANIHNADHSIIEMKGKNNKAPAAKYANAVVAYVRKEELKLSGAAVYDFERSGYFYIQEQLFTRKMAIAKFVKTTRVGESEGAVITRVIWKRGEPNLDNLMNKIWPGVARLDGDVEILQATKGGKTTEMILRNKMVQSILDRKDAPDDGPINEAAGEGDVSNVRALLAYAYDNEHAVGQTDAVRDKLFWDYRLRVDTKTGTVGNVNHTTVKHNDDEHDVEVHHQADAIDSIKSTLTSQDHYSHSKHAAASNKHYVGKKPTGDNVGLVQSDEVEQEDGTLVRNNVIMNIVDGVLHLSTKGRKNSVGWGMEQNAPGTVDENTRDPKMIKTIISVANNKHVDIDPGFKATHGILTDTSGKHSIADIHPQKTDWGVKYDLSNYDQMSKVVVFNYITNNARARVPGSDGQVRGIKTRNKIHENDLGYKDVPGDDNWRMNSGTGPRMGYHDPSQLITDANIKNVDAIHMLDVDYAGGKEKHRIAMTIADKVVTGIDDTTLAHKFKHWEDHKDVAEQINTHLDKFGLKLASGILHAGAKYKKNRESSVELRQGTKGRVTTAAEKAKASLTKMAEKTSDRDSQELVFKDGEKLTPMDVDSQVEYYRKYLQINTVPGQAWELRGTDGKLDGVLIVKNKKIVTFYSGGPAYGSSSPGFPDDQYPSIHTAVPPSLHGYVKKAKQVMGWTETPAHAKRGASVKKTYSSDAYVLRHLNRANSFVVEYRPTEEQEASRHGGHLGQLVGNVQGMGKVFKRHMDQMVKADLVSEEETDRGGNQAFKYKILPAGKKVLWANVRKNRQTDAGQDDTHLKAHDLHDDFERIAEPEAPPPRAPRAAGAAPAGNANAPRTGTKAAQALALYTQMTTDNDRLPTRAEFIAAMQQDPFNMSAAGASTYHHNTKKKYALLNEKFSILAGLELMEELMEERNNPSSLRSYLLLGDLWK